MENGCKITPAQDYPRLWKRIFFNNHHNQSLQNQKHVQLFLKITRTAKIYRHEFESGKKNKISDQK